MQKIAYLAHDIGDAAVARRVTMLRAGGAEVALAGFHRRAAPANVAGIAPIDLGRTADARLIARAGAVVRQLVLPVRARRAVAGADVVIARNLEMLAIATRVASPGQRIVYECLDIHRLLLRDGPAARLLRALERRLLARVALVLTSAPAFAERYFRAIQHHAGPIRIEENRLLALDGEPATPPIRGDGPPWRIGWYGMIRCRRSLALLRALVQASAGAVEVVIAGVPSRTEFEDFDRDVQGVPGLRFAGRYAPDDLARIYGDVHFAWAIDYFEEGLNSSWLLPNRLYESLAHGAVPIALANVETGRWLGDRDAGVRLDDAERDLAPMIAALTAERYRALAKSARAVLRAAVVATQADCVALVQAVTGRGDG